MSKVIIIGGGAAGMMAAVAALDNSSEVVIYDGNEKLGKKIYITGKGRCNLTNACDISEYFENIISNDKFLYSALYSFTNDDVISFFEENGCPIKVERGNRAFPRSDKSSDIIKTLERYIKSNGAKIVLNTKVKSIIYENNKANNDNEKDAFVKRAIGVKLSDNTKDYADNIIVATGGLSYQTTGSTGDGLQFAKDSGHKVMPCRPALVPFEVKEDYIIKLQGLSLKNVTLSICCNNKRIYDGFGEMLFTHFGVSGPLVLSASSVVGKYFDTSSTLKGVVDLKPALSYNQLDERILRDINNNRNKEFKSLVAGLLPSKMVDVIINMLNVDSHLKLNGLTKVKRQELVHLLKEFTFTITKTRDYKEAIITQGGVSVGDINPSTMESNLVKGLFFAGEVIDIDALTGGFNLQLAFSTGHLAGVNASINN
ncbi:MAG: NAD(P)/FAD-dependent oxidoreductase [Lachnospiraceae bacterium]|nr:NAD(P)/FAD-dependent oxidoreductase [Lachnospiraceae bacterium]